MFLIDASGSVKRTNFEKQMDFVKDFVRSLTIGPNADLVGVTAFSTLPRNPVWMNSHTEKNNLLAAIDNIPYPGGSSHTEHALKFARLQAFTTKYGDRADVPNVLILLTDGQSTVPTETVKEAELVHKAGITVYAVGIGNTIDMSELQMIASSPDKVLSVANFDALQNILADLEKATGCSGGGPLTTTVLPETTT